MADEEWEVYRAKMLKELDAQDLQTDIDRPYSTTQSRYASRAYNIWGTRRLGGIRHYFWWVVHNSVVHPLLGIAPCMVTFKLHDWASRKLNGK